MLRHACRLLGAAALVLAAANFVNAAPADPAEEPVRLATGDAALDRTGDGLQDVIFADRTVYYDLDGDGWFDYGLAFAFKEFTSEGHRRYVASGLDPGVFAELTRQGLDSLCASERVAANWTAEHFDEFLYYHDGYGRLVILDRSPGNDGRLAAERPRPRPEYTVVFNPDGTVATVHRGQRSVELAAFDYDKNVSAGTRLVLPRIAGPADLAGIRSELGKLFATGE